MEERHSVTLKNRLKSSLCFSCCFSGHHRGGDLPSPVSGEEDGGGDDDMPRLIRVSSTWLRSRAQDLPEIRDKCRNLISRMGRGRRSSRDFRYDPLSYALNFDEGFEESNRCADEFPPRSFSTRFPASPPQNPTGG